MLLKKLLKKFSEVLKKTRLKKSPPDKSGGLFNLILFRSLLASLSKSLGLWFFNRWVSHA